jgi:CMP-N-acetylneuraminic acid synthetase
MKRERVLAIIPARKGSKRLVNKNLLSLNGKPLIEWTINEAQKATCISELIVSTDSLEIKKFSETKGVHVPFLRPEEFSGDTATSIDVVFHALEFFKNKGITFEYCLLLQPTSPLRSDHDIENAFNLLNETTEGVVSVCELDHSPLWSNTLPDDGSMKHFLSDEIKNKRSQDLEPYYRLNGAIYIASVDYLYQNQSFIGEKTKAYIMPKDRSVDIDDEIDFFTAEHLLKKKKDEK